MTPPDGTLGSGPPRRSAGGTYPTVTSDAMADIRDHDLLRELAPTAEELLARHLRQAKEWFPHETTPWDRAAATDPGGPWDESKTDLPAAVRSSLIVNVLTEDNLPYYLNDLDAIFGRDSAWGAWAGRWTAEEGRHAIAIRDYLVVSGAVDPVALERDRMVQMTAGEVPGARPALGALVYLTVQELATRIAHMNTGRLLDDPAGYEVMKRVAADENLHHLFYRDAAAAALAIDPSRGVIEMEHEIRTFAMPGTGIPGFVEHARAIAGAGIYTFGIHHDQIVEPLVRRHWRVEELTGLSDEAERARDRLFRFLGRLQTAARRQERGAEKARSTELASA